ncbi:hypothetical protein DW898_10750 [Ruminococcus sp. AM41-2AC]|nr:hypothetical protein DW898_10750 [Ruminococcus sp. AM41-2AC]
MSKDNENKENILIVHNYYQIPGGEDTVVANEKKMLEKHGHKVTLYSRNNAELKKMPRLRKIFLPITTVFNPRTYRDIKKLVKQENIEVVHVHNTLNLVSPAVYYAARRMKVPVVQTIHNFRLLCPGATFYRDGHICEDCVEHGLKCAVRHSCYRKSKIQTLACVLSTAFHRMTGIYGKINYICLTDFNKQKLLGLTSIMNIVTVSINQAVTPWIYEMLEAKKMREIGKNVYKIVSLVGVGFVLTSFIVPEVIGVLAPSEYQSAIWATPPLLIGMFMYFIYCNFGNVEIYFHKQNAMLFSSVTVAAINIILDYILIQKYGYIAASYATMVSYYIYAGLHYMFMSRVCKEKKVENPFNASVIIVMTIVFSVLIMCPALLYRVVLLRYSILAVMCIVCIVWAIKNRDFILQLISKKRV